MRVMKQDSEAAGGTVMIDTSVKFAYACPTKRMVPRYLS